MANVIKLHKGLNINLKGKAAQEIFTVNAPDTYALVPVFLVFGARVFAVDHAVAFLDREGDEDAAFVALAFAEGDNGRDVAGFLLGRQDDGADFLFLRELLEQDVIVNGLNHRDFVPSFLTCKKEFSLFFSSVNT